MDWQEKEDRLGNSNTSTRPTGKCCDMHAVSCMILHEHHSRSQMLSHLDQSQFKKCNRKKPTQLFILAKQRSTVIIHYNSTGKILTSLHEFVKRGFIVWSYHDLVFHDHLQCQDRKAKVMKAVPRNFCIVWMTSLHLITHHWVSSPLV